MGQDRGAFSLKRALGIFLGNDPELKIVVSGQPFNFLICMCQGGGAFYPKAIVRHILEGLRCYLHVAEGSFVGLSFVAL